MILTDARLVKILKGLKARPELEYKKLTAEVVRLHRDIPNAAPRGKSISDARLRVAADRSRIVGIKLSCLEEYYDLNNVHDRLNDYLRTRYHNFLGSGYSTQSARDAVLSNALAPLSKRIKSIKALLEVIDTALGDYDAKAYALRDTVAALTLAEREA